MRPARIPAIFIVSLLLLLSAISSHGSELVIVPGHINGTVYTNTPDQQVRNIYVRAIGNGCSASNNINNSNSYRLTVQSGGWDYLTSVQANVAPANATAPSTRLTFSDRSIPVTAGETVINDYNATGTVHFNVNITGDTYTSWKAEAAAYVAASPGKGQTDSLGTSNSSSMLDWEMPVVPNQGIQIEASVTVYSSTGSVRYDFFTTAAPDTPLYLDIADGQVVNVDLDVVHVAPPPVVTTPPAPNPNPTPKPDGTCDYDMRFYLDMNIDGESYNDLIVRHDWTNQSGNPGHKTGTTSCTGTRPFWMKFPAATIFSSRFLVWPRDTVNLTYADLAPSGQTSYFYFNEAAGMVRGHLKFTGAATNASFSKSQLVFSGIENIFDPTTGQDVLPATAGAYSNFVLQDPVANPDGEFTMFLTGGPWQTSQVTAEKIVLPSSNPQGGYSSTTLTIKDNNYLYDGKTNNFGQNLEVVAGRSTSHEQEYCLGKAIFRFRSIDGSLLESPSVYAYGTGREMTVSMTSHSNFGLMPAPETEIYGPAMNYRNTSLSVHAEDGSYMSFSPQTFSLECGVTKVIPVPGPSLSVASPQEGIITNAASITVTGLANGDLGISGVTVNGSPATLTPTGNPAVPQQVAFSHELPLAEGTNTIITEATDSGGNQATDQRSIKVDRTTPIIVLDNPSTAASYPTGSQVDLAWSIMDLGYGFSYQLYLDGVLLVNGTQTPQDNTAWEMRGDSVTITARQGGQQVSIVATDLAGNTASTTLTVTGNTPPRLDPIASLTLPEGGSLSLTANATDLEGTTLTYAWDFNHDGNFETAGQTVNFSAADLDGPGQTTIVVMVTDAGGLTDQTSVAVTIDNVAPSADFANTSGTVTEGGAATIAFVNSVDPGVADLAAGLTYSYDCNGDGIFELAGAQATTFACPYADNGTYTITGMIEDKDGGARRYSLVIEVANAAPVVEALTVNPLSLYTGSTVEVSALFSDLGIEDSHAATVTWGDPSPASNGLVTESAGSGAVTASHLYPTAGNYPIMLTVIDKDGGSVTVAATVSVTSPGEDGDDDHHDEEGRGHGDRDDHHSDGSGHDDGKDHGDDSHRDHNHDRNDNGKNSNHDGDKRDRQGENPDREGRKGS